MRRLPARVVAVERFKGDRQSGSGPWRMSGTIWPGRWLRLPNYLTSDAVFGVKKALISSYERIDDGEAVWHSAFDFVLAPE